jgi:hypothetical protein
MGWNWVSKNWYGDFVENVYLEGWGDRLITFRYHLIKIDCEDGRLIELVCDCVQWRTFALAVLNLQVMLPECWFSSVKLMIAVNVICTELHFHSPYHSKSGCKKWSFIRNVQVIFNVLPCYLYAWCQCNESFIALNHFVRLPHSYSPVY